jgi:prepilin-type N-terminal cleavage/methylation domain-containing protein
VRPHRKKSRFSKSGKERGAVEKTVQNRRTGFTLVEVLIVVVIMAVLAATIIPQFSDSARDAKISTAKFNLNTLRTQIQFYSAQHNGAYPSATLAELISKTDASGAIGTGATHIYGPYVTAIPDNPFTNSNKVTAATANPPAAASGATDAGWLYHAASGGLWLDDADLLTE